MLSVSTENTLYVIQRSKLKTNQPQALKIKNRWKTEVSRKSFLDPFNFKLTLVVICALGFCLMV